MPKLMLAFLNLRCPAVVSKMTTGLGKILMGMHYMTGLRRNSLVKPPVLKYDTVAVLPTSTVVPITAFCLELQHALSGIGSVIRLSSTVVMNQLGPMAFDARYEYRLNSWLSEQHDDFTSVIYQCDPTATIWTRKCIRNADGILILTLAAEGPAVTNAEMNLEQVVKEKKKDLVLLHPSNTKYPIGIFILLRYFTYVLNYFGLLFLLPFMVTRWRCMLFI